MAFGGSGFSTAGLTIGSTGAARSGRPPSPDVRVFSSCDMMVVWDQRELAKKELRLREAGLAAWVCSMT